MANPLDERKGPVDADRSKEKSVAERKAEAAALRPVRDYPLAATSTSDFVKDEVEVDHEEPAPKTKGKKDPQAELAAKNAATDAKRKAEIEAKREAEAADASAGTASTVVPPTKTK